VLCTDKKHKKVFPQFPQNENSFVKIGKLFANFAKKYSHFQIIGENFLYFSQHFLIICDDVNSSIEQVR